MSPSDLLSEGLVRVLAARRRAGAAVRFRDRAQRGCRPLP
jgi:hypothetical protein